MRKTPGIILVAILLLIVGISVASVDKQLDVTASVDPATNFTVMLFRSLTSTTYDWSINRFPDMAFGTLVNAVPGNTSSALMANVGYLAYVSVLNNNGLPYRVQYTGNRLTHTDGVTNLSNDAFVVSAGDHFLNATAVATVCDSCISKARRSAGAATYDVYTSNAQGVSDQFDMFFGITGDPANATNADGVGNITLIPPAQKSGSYTAHVHLTLYP
jgi:hypothetical protein